MKTLKQILRDYAEEEATKILRRAFTENQAHLGADAYASIHRDLTEGIIKMYEEEK